MTKPAASSRATRTPTARFSPLLPTPSNTSIAKACSITSTPAMSADWSSVRCTSAPDWSPPACTMRRCEWPPSRVRSGAPSAPGSNAAPKRVRYRIAVGASSTNVRTACSLHKPAPAVSVSATCASSESVGSSTAAKPPCAHCVLPASSVPLVTSNTSRTGRTANAAAKPAAPLPSTTTSTSRSHVGAGAASCVGNNAAKGDACTYSPVGDGVPKAIMRSTD